ncbi:MAG: PqiC family protein [Desulfuromonadaceae bacterium]|nr:PqiC family protein [Desulfuromonadaceae bacterium]
MSNISHFALLCCLATSFIIGCSHAPRIAYYSFDTTEKPALAAVSSGTKREKPSVSIETPTLPELVNRLQLVQRINASQVEILEFHRWAEPLKSSISRCLTVNLSQLLDSDLVSAYPQNIGSDAAYRVFVDFQRFEFDGSAVTLDAQWSIRNGSGDRLKSGRVRSHVLTDREGYEAAVAAYSRALTVLSSAIAESLQTEWSTAAEQKK